MTLELLLAAALVVAVVVLVGAPFLRESPPPETPLAAETEAARVAARDRALAELKELEFDHRTGKVTDEDYRAQVGPLRRRAASLLPPETPEQGPEQHFSTASARSGRPDL